MAKIPGLNLSQDEVSQTIDLEKWTGADLSQDPVLLREIGQEIVDYMKERVAQGVGAGEVSFKANKYSPEYQASLAFKAAGKDSSPVNMKLSGDMLGSMDFIDNENQLKFSIAGDQSPKAYGHMTGFEGHPTIPQGKYKREFFGITKAEFEKNILPKFKDDIENITPRQGEDTQGQAISELRASDLFETDLRLDISLYRILQNIIADEGAE